MNRQSRSQFPTVAVLIFLIGANVVIELMLVAADYGVLGSTRWRGMAYHNGAFGQLAPELQGATLHHFFSVTRFCMVGWGI